ncbi:MAG: NADH-quinone oxidoreductase subunit L [Planctomycetes bacterium]|nr:NADH-quinone oxidoreductase subunit L [Planctomycetota bacterium]
MMIWILLLPLIGFTIQIFVGNKLPRRGDWVPTAAIGGSLVLALSLFVRAIKMHKPDLLVHTAHPEGASVADTNGLAINWLTSASPDGNFVFAFLFDNITAVMLVVVTLVSFLVHVFSIGYMHGDKRYNRFFAHLGLFSFSMIGLVLSANFLFLLIFWELVGLCSYLLIGYYFEKESAANACKKAFLTCRVGDTLMLIGMLLIWKHTGTFDFVEIFDQVAKATAANGGAPPDWCLTAGILVFCGPIGKSAQFPLHIWLPDAMEGPTPVSALIHAATMVVAGVFLVARMFPYYMFVPDAMLVIALFGAVTAIFAATIGITQWDIKKVLAYSTVSQLGFMVAALGCGSLSAGFFHLMTHAWFKACLFLGSGSVIHGMHHHQDMRQMGGLRHKMPVTYWCMLLSTCAIAGVPLFSGFYSKDAIIAATLDPHAGFQGVAGWEQAGEGFLWSLPSLLIPIAALMTAFYMFRLIFLTFHGEPKSEHAEQAHESPWTMTLPLVVLGTLGVFGAAPWILDFDFMGHDIWFNHVVTNPTFDAAAGVIAYPAVVPEHHHSWLPVIISLIVAGSGILLAFSFYKWKRFSPEKAAKKWGSLYRWCFNKYYVDEFVLKVVVRPLVFTWNVWCAAFDKFVIDGLVNGVGRTGKQLADGSGWADKNIVDGFVNAMAFMTQIFGAIARIFQTGFLQHYLTVLAGGAAAGTAIFYFFL